MLLLNKGYIAGFVIFQATQPWQPPIVRPLVETQIRSRLPSGPIANSTAHN